MHYSIDEICRAGCTTPRGVRFWQEKGLLGDVARSAGNQRRFDDAHLDKVRIIAACQLAGMQIAEIRYILDNYDESIRWNVISRLQKVGQDIATAQASLPVVGQPMLDL